MKKFFILLVMLLTFSSVFSEEKTVDKVFNGVSAVHTDTRDAISTLHEDATKIVENVYSDSKSVVGVIYDDVNKIVKYAVPKLEAGLVALAQTLKTTVAEVYRVMVMKQIAQSVAYLCYGLFAFLFMYICYRIIKVPDDKLLGERDYTGERSWKPQYIISFGLSAGCSISLLLAFVVNFKDMIIGFIAPEYGAIQEIITIVDTLLK